jgi:hypothetical protein
VLAVGAVRSPDATSLTWPVYRAAKVVSPYRSFTLGERHGPNVLTGWSLRLVVTVPLRGECGTARTRRTFIMSMGPRWLITHEMNGWSMTSLAAVGLTALWIVAAAPASAAARHDGASGVGEHSSAGVGGVMEAPAPDSAPRTEATAPEASPAGHDKCKRPKGNRRLLPWCQDPAGGFIGSSTLRVPSPSAGPTSICDPTSSAPLTRCVPVPPVRPDPSVLPDR